MQSYLEMHYQVIITFRLIDTFEVAIAQMMYNEGWRPEGS